MKIVALLCFVVAPPFAALAQQPSPSPTPWVIPDAPRSHWLEPVAPGPAPTVRPAVSKPHTAAAAPPVDPTPDLVTVSGKRYKHARVGTVDPDGINYFFDGGVVKIPFTDLPEGIRKQYGYDPKAAAAFAAQDAAVQQSLAETAASQELAVQNQHQAEVDAAEREKQRAEARARATKLRIEVIESLSGGVLAHPYEKHVVLADSGDSLTSVGGGGGYALGGGMSMSPSEYKTIFVQGVPPTADGDSIDVLAHEDGLFTFTGTDGATKTVVKWVSDN